MANQTAACGNNIFTSAAASNVINFTVDKNTTFASAFFYPQVISTSAGAGTVMDYNTTVWYPSILIPSTDTKVNVESIGGASMPRGEEITKCSLCGKELKGDGKLEVTELLLHPLDYHPVKYHIVCHEAICRVRDGKNTLECHISFIDAEKSLIETLKDPYAFNREIIEKSDVFKEWESRNLYNGKFGKYIVFEYPSQEQKPAKRKSNEQRLLLTSDLMR